eukprot:TRINITY_DN2757_c0_g1_i1.p1 TRINITY_DN2757_c0_g1~~TRINITY_DN2757_c0_g1_i1.p1  ORF type:complete len:208 (+),score=62.17 TRINITY_DN2757_c0_g1_i1:99-722(+)
MKILKIPVVCVLLFFLLQLATTEEELPDEEGLPDEQLPDEELPDEQLPDEQLPEGELPEDEGPAINFDEHFDTYNETNALDSINALLWEADGDKDEFLSIQELAFGHRSVNHTGELSKEELETGELSKEELDQAQQDFKTYDEDKNGKLDRIEVAALVGTEYAHHAEVPGADEPGAEVPGPEGDDENREIDYDDVYSPPEDSTKEEL